MLFNSYLFLFAFLPIALIGYYFIGKYSNKKWTIIWLILISLVFYGWYNPAYLFFLIGSIIVNYSLGIIIANKTNISTRKTLVTIGIIINILSLGYFKYTNFFIDNINTILKTDLVLNTIILPLAISFFTIQQIGYLVDVYRKETTKYNFLEYCLFVVFFPKLISGPIARFKEIIPQLQSKEFPRLDRNNFSVGITVFFLGLFKKVILADYIAGLANPVFTAASQGAVVHFFDAWTGAFAYAFQIYFDFSAYSDMAIGLGLLFGIRLPLNFFSPYKATNPSDFWRRWHITLSRFIRDYLYIPLGGNRKGFSRQMISLLVAMTIAGIWHGAGWTFVIWGLLHGIYLVFYHSWKRLRKSLGMPPDKPNWWKTSISVAFTFLAVTIAWVFFRSNNIATALGVFKGMFGFNKIVLPLNFASRLDAIIPGISHILSIVGIHFVANASALVFKPSALAFLFICFVICWLVYFLY